MPPLVIHAARAFTPLEEIRDAAIVVEDGRIASVGPREGLRLPAGATEQDARQFIAVPGFVDVHIHGAGGHDVMEATPTALRAVASTVARHGTTSILATTVTANPDDTCRSVDAIASFARGQKADSCAEILGVHFEGPFISHARRGVHPAEWIAAPSVELLRRLLAAAGDMGRILTLAPELPGALELVAQARAAGLVVSMGHTDATCDQATAAINIGAAHAVHVYNAMRPFTHRDSGVLGAVLTSPQVTAELIADGVHVDEAAMRLLLAAKGTERVVLVSDATAATGMPDGVYRLGPFEVNVKDGVCRNAGGKLAGSTLTLDRALRVIRPLVAQPAPSNILRMATLNPARLLGLEKRKGVLAPGADADIVLLDDAWNVRSVFCRGVQVPA